jgi:hypothetical protein
MRQNEEPNSWMIVLSGGVFAILLVAAIFALQAYFHQSEGQENDRKVVSVAPEELALARAQQIGQINGYRWIDRASGAVAIPIEVAMEKVVREGARPLVAPSVAAVPVSGKGK